MNVQLIIHLNGILAINFYLKQTDSSEEKNAMDLNENEKEIVMECSRIAKYDHE